MSLGCRLVGPQTRLAAEQMRLGIPFASFRLHVLSAPSGRQTIAGRRFLRSPEASGNAVARCIHTGHCTTIRSGRGVAQASLHPPILKPPPGGNRRTQLDRSIIATVIALNETLLTLGNVGNSGSVSIPACQGRQGRDPTFPSGERVQPFRDEAKGMYGSGLPDREATETGWGNPRGKRLRAVPVSAGRRTIAVAFAPVPASGAGAPEVACAESCDRWLRRARFLRNSGTPTADERPRRTKWLRRRRR